MGKNLDLIEEKYQTFKLFYQISITLKTNSLQNIYIRKLLIYA